MRRKVGLAESLSEALVRANGCVHRAVRHAWRNAHPANCAEQTTPERPHIRRVHADDVRNAAGKDIAEEAETRSQDRMRRELPRDGRSRLQNGERGGIEQFAKMSFDGGAQRLINVM